MKLYLVWNKSKSECVGFLDKADADWTAKGGRHPHVWLPSVGEAFRETYGDDMKKLPQTTVEI